MNIKSRVRIVGIKILARPCALKRFARVRNGVIHNLCGVEKSQESEESENVFWWYVHVIRMDERGQ